jgi:guanine deaminase
MEGKGSVDKVFKGTYIHAVTLGDIEVVQNGGIGVSSTGDIVFAAKSEEEFNEAIKQHNFDVSKVINLGKKFLVPGFIDTHCHAPQYLFTGTATGIPLLEWLEKFTFNYESKFNNLDFAREVYTKVVKRTLRCGNTMTVYFATIHLEATKLLANLCQQYGQRAYVGLVSMDQNSPPHYITPTDQSIEEARDFAKFTTDGKAGPLVTSIVTPRFAPTCSDKLMTNLGSIAKEFNIPIQSHISENKGEIAWVKELFPQHESYSHVYDHYGLLNERTIMAHAVYLTDKELALFKQRGAGISHCPLSNFSLCSGFLDSRKVINEGVKLSIGTDVSGGYSPYVLANIRGAIHNSSIHYVNSDAIGTNKPNTTLTWKEAFYLATVGGSQVVGMEDKLGNFKVGKNFDALVIDPFANDSPVDIFSVDTIEQILEKFIFNGDDRNISEVYVQGRKVVPF